METEKSVFRTPECAWPKMLILFFCQTYRLTSTLGKYLNNQGVSIYPFGLSFFLKAITSGYR